MVMRATLSSESFSLCCSLLSVSGAVNFPATDARTPARSRPTRDERSKEQLKEVLDNLLQGGR